ncbi:hypothetical protein FDB34_15910 [Clostridium botulinum]|uniref:hypothetical protein n=1 Tax=Clostridium botulinum TaxID=1491 RepID=UPI0013FB7877|nr:hypothetical protein [Clostridium botulinum]MBN1065389.1 hypothetical protein [Clostridium botulinum]NFO15640.1 hypothetical protein [Clostridium botulinum]
MSVANYCSKFSYYNTSIIVIDKRTLDEKRLVDMSTYAKFIGDDLCGEPDDNHRDGFADKYKEYDYFGVIKEFIVLPKWLVEYLLSIRNVELCYCEGACNKFGVNEEQIEGDKLKYLYENDNYVNADELYEKNKYLKVTSDGKRLLKYEKEDCIKSLDEIIHYVDKNSKAIEIRKRIDKILNMYIKMKCCPKKNLDFVPSKVFYHEYYEKNKSIKEVADLFLKKGFIKDIIKDKEETYRIINKIKYLTLFQLIKIFGEEKVAIEEDNINILYNDINQMVLESYSDYLELANINTKEFNKRYKSYITEHIKIKKENPCRLLKSTKYKLIDIINYEDINKYWENECELDK